VAKKLCDNAVISSVGVVNVVNVFKKMNKNDGSKKYFD
jgi:hypothetical protein